MINTLKKYIYISLGIHLFIFIALLILNSSNNIKQPFVVFGAYSKKKLHTLYKTKNKAVPFVTNNSHETSKHGSKSGKLGTRKNKYGKSENLEKRNGKNGSTKKLALNQSSNKKNSGTKKSNFTEKTKKIQSKKSSLIKNKRNIKLKSEIKYNKLNEKKFKEELKKMELEAKKEIEKEEKKKTDIKQKEFKEKKKSEEKIKQEVKEIEQKEIQPEESTNTSTNDTFNEKEINDSQTEEHEASNLEYNSNEEFIFTLSGEIDKKFEVYQKYLQQEVQRLWSPPLGVPKGTTCRIKFVIDQSGKVSNFENIKKSKVLIYDLSILRIAHQFKFDKCLWGKSFIIDFCQ